MSSTKTTSEDAKEAEAMQQQTPSAPPLLQEEATQQQNNPSAPLMPSEPTTMQRNLDPSDEPPMGPPPSYSEAMHSSPYRSTSAPYPLMSDVSSPMPRPVDAVASSTAYNQQPIGFNTPTAGYQQQQQQQPIVNQPAAQDDEFVHPKTTYVVLDQRSQPSDDCSCLDWLACCVCCMEMCRCLVECAHCFAECSK